MISIIDEKEMIEDYISLKSLTYRIKKALLIFGGEFNDFSRY